MDVSVERTSTERGSLAILVEGYMYRKEREYDNYTTWRCTRKSCKARCKTGNDNIIKLIDRSKIDHNHEKDEKSNVLSDIRQSIKRKADETLNARTAKVICTGIAGKEEHLTTRDIHNLKTCFYRHRASQRPTLPRSIEGTLDILQEVANGNTKYGLLSSCERIVSTVLF